MTPLVRLNAVEHEGEGHAVLSQGDPSATLQADPETSTTLNDAPFVQPCTSMVLDARRFTNTEPASMSCRDATIVNDPIAPTTLLPLAAADLEAAAARLRPDPAIRKALQRLLEGGWSYRDDGRLVITFDARSQGRKGKPARPYTTTADSCTCPGAIIRGACYHPVAWQVVNEAIIPTTSVECVLHSAMFLSLSLLALSAGTDRVTLQADSRRSTLTLAAADLITGTISVETATPITLTIEQQVRVADLKRVIDALADVLPQEGEQLMLDVNTDSLLIIVGTKDAPMFVDGLVTLPMDAPTERAA